MPGKYLLVSIFDVLFARGEPLLETELWSVLNQCAICLLELLRHGDKKLSEISNLAITPDSLGFRSDGSAGISSTSAQQTNLYSAPELHHSPCKCASDVEKSFIYSLGKVLYYAAEYSPDRKQDTGISRQLESILSAMCDENSASRVTLEQVLQACSIFAERHMDSDYPLCTRQMYTYLMGSSESEDDSMQGIQSLSGKDKENRAQRIRGKHKRKSRSRSRSRSPSRRDRSDDSGYYQPLKGHRNGNQHHDTNQPPSYNEHRSLYSTPPSAGRSYHLSDITFSLDSNSFPQKSKNHNSYSHSLSTSHNNQTQQRPSSGLSFHKNETARDKYLRLKERQRKLQILRRGLYGGLPEDQTAVLLSEPLDFPGADTRSVVSMLSYTQGAYMPELHTKYGSEMALRMGRESDRESIISSEASTIHDHHAMRSADILYAADQHVPVVEKTTKQRIPDINLPQQKAKEYYGPEFVHKTSKPIMRVPVPLRGDSLKSASHGRRVVIVLLTGQKLEAMVDPSITGQQMFESIITHIELPEFFFFGLTYVNDGEHFFIEPDTKLHKIAPEGWKDGWKGNMPTITLTIYLRMKFYPDHLGMLRHQISRHLLFLQLRHDILEERLLCNEDRCMALTGLALQAEYGDYDKETMGRNYFMQEQYYPSRIVKKVGTSYIRDNTAEVHEKYSGMTDRQAELDFIKMCMNLHEYGVHFYKLNRRKNDSNSIVWVGISVRYLVLAENQSHQRVIIQQDPWNMIQKISFNKHRFSIQSKPDYGKGKPPKLNYFTNSFRKGRYLLQFATAQHRFQLNMRAREAQIDSQDLTLDSLAELDAEHNMVDTDRTDHEPASDPHGPEVIPSSHNSRNVINGPTSDRLQIPNMIPPPYMADTSVSMLDLRQKYALPQHKRAPRLHAASTGDIVTDVNRDGPADPMYVIEMANQSLDPLEDEPPNETVSTTLQHRFCNELLSPEYPDRHIFEVTLEKEPQVGIGITIVGGESTSKLDLGIFVKSVTPKGPADRDGRIKSGDRLIAINEQSLEGVQHHIAVQMIRDSKDRVKLLVSQFKAPSSIKRKSYEDITPVKVPGSDASPGDRNVYRQLSLPDDVDHSVYSDVNIDINVIADQNQVDIPVSSYSNGDQSVVDVSTISHVESMQSEIISANENQGVYIPVRDPDDTDNDAESLTDSEIDEGIQAIVEGRSLEEVKIEDSFRPAEQNEWMKIESIEGTKQHVSLLDTYKVILEKKDGGFGLNVTGGTNTSVKYGGIYVKSLTPGASAAIEGSIQKGDRILEVNEVPLKDVTHKQAVEIIHSAPSLSVFVLEKRSTSSQHSSIKSVSSGSSSEVKHTTEEVIKEKEILPEIEPNVEANMKIKSTGLITPVSDQMDKEHKKPLSTEQISVTKPGVLDSSDQDESKEQQEDCEYYPFVDKDGIYDVDITKGSIGFGFSLHGGTDMGTSHGAVHIKKLFNIGPAAASGKIKEGDVILEVNGKSLKGLTHAGAVAVLRSEHQVNLLMYRPKPEQLPQWFLSENDEYIEHPASSKKIEDTSFSETESEDEPILYRDTLPMRESVITPPSAFTSPRSDHSEQFVAPPSSPPPPLPKSPPPSFSVQSSPGIPGNRKVTSPSLSLRSEPAESAKDKYAMGRWGDFENLKIAVSPRSVYSTDMNSTFGIEDDRSDVDDRLNQRVQVGGYLKGLARSDSSQSEDSQSSTDSIVRSPLKDTYGTSDSMRSTNSEDRLRRHHGDEQNSEDTDGELDDETSDFQEPTAPRGSPCNDEMSDEVDGFEEQREEDEENENNSENEMSHSLRPGEIDVVLRKEGRGLGFTLTGGANKGGCFIKGIVHDPALSDGRLKAGDKLIKVNDIDLTNLSHSEAVTYFKEAVGNVRIRVYRDPSLETAQEDEIQKSEDIGQELKLELTDSLLTQSSGYEADSALTTAELTDVTGIVSQGDNSNIKHTEALFSFLDGQIDDSQDESDSESDKETPKKENDRKSSDDDIVGEIERKTSFTEEKNDSPFPSNTLENEELARKSSFEGELSHHSEPRVLKIELKKSQAYGLGFSLVTAEKDNQTGVFVRSISANGAADQDGRLQIMDRILQINGESLVGLTHSRAIQMIRSATDKVVLTVSRLSLRQLNVMTPPIIMSNSDDDDDEYDVDDYSESERFDDRQETYSESERFDDRQETYSDEESEYDSEEEEEMNALVTAAEKLLAESGTIELNPEQLSEFSEQVSFVDQMKDKWNEELQQSDSEGSDSDEKFPNTNTEELQQINIEELQQINNDNLQCSNSGELQQTNSEELKEINPEEFQGTYSQELQKSDYQELQQINPGEFQETYSGELQQSNFEELQEINPETFPESYSGELQQSDSEEHQPENAEEFQETFSGELQQTNPEFQGTHSGELQHSDSEELQQTNSEEIQEFVNTEFDSKNKTFTIVALQRKLDIEIPETVTEKWLSSLPLLSMSEEAKPSVQSLINTIQYKLDQDDPVEEYKELRQVKATDDCSVARLPENKARNRFRNILPYDLNRVTLSSENDYINASHVLMNVGDLESHYIACQGPLLNTAEEFWQMIWEQEVSVIAMLTLDIENGKVKCHQYWPDSMETPLFICEGKFKISLISVQNLEHIIVKTLEMSNLTTGKSQIIYHFTYKSWPDHGPPQSMPLLQCLQLVHVHHTTGPIVVHCSAGIGRTGAFITMDLALGQIEKSGRCDIFEIVTELRKQRYGMIQTKDQYVLCYLACLEALTNGS